MIEPIDLRAILDLHHKMAGRVDYRLGAKANGGGRPLLCDSNAIRQIDCSGYTRYLIAKATCGRVLLPDGSQAQIAWARSYLRRRLGRYEDVRYAAEDPSRLFIAFLSPSPGKEWPRHVWLVHRGLTLESCGSRGVCSRPWNEPVLLRNNVGAWEIPVR